MSKQNFSFIVILFIIVGLLATGNYLYKNTDKVNELNTYIASNCTISEDFCLSLQNALRPLLILDYEVKTQKISKEVVPSIHIYLSDGALHKISEKRIHTLEKPTPILLTNKDDWVKGKLITNDGITEKETPISLRLKGDWGDHLKNPYKLSFRIDPKGNETVMGMSRFSIQAPGTRQFYFEPMFMEQMRRVGILTPRYFFVQVWINDYPIGLMAVEEHFTKELLESQGRREGSIFSFDEDPIWYQRNLNHNTYKNHQFLVPAGIDRGLLTHQMRDFVIKDYRKVLHGSSDLASTQSALGQSLLRDYIEGTVAANQVFDMQQFSSWWALSHIWGACHGVTSHNRRFYYNAITNKLEPIAFDTVAEPHNFSMCADELEGSKLLSDPNFRKYLYAELERWGELLYDEKYTADFEAQQQQYRALFDTEELRYPETNIYLLRDNLITFTENLSNLIPNSEGDNGKLSDLENITNVTLLKSDIDFYMPLRSFVYFDDVLTRETLKVELKNLSLDKIQIKKIYYQSKAGNNQNVLDQDFVLGIFDETDIEAKAHLETRTVDWHVNYPQNSELRVVYQFRDKEYDQLVTPQYSNHDFAFADFLQHTSEVSDKIIVQENQKTVIFPKATYIFNENYSLPSEWSMLVMPGSELVFKGVALRLKGALTMVADADNPILIDVETDTSFKGLGIWGRQDYFGLTGCLTFYESDVEIHNSYFKNLQCEDALNIVRSTYQLNQIQIDSSRADAFDSDFSLGNITNSHFLNIGNDGVDISGTTLNLDNSFFTNIGDKAISVGEKSQLTSSNLVIEQASTGVASKDLSIANLSDIKFREIKGTGLITYIKKPEYGPANINCTNCIFVDSPEVYANQSQSTIILNNKDIGVQNFNHSQMVEIGYLLN